MGFRDPITSATDLDTTAAPGGAGVIITGGRATWQDGTGGSGYIEVKSSGGGSIAGEEFDVVGPTGGTTVPMVRQYLQDAPAFGYNSVIELDADILRLQRAVELLVPITALPLNATYFGKYDTTALETGAYRNPYYWQLADGMVVTVGMVAVNSTAFALGATVATLPAGCRPKKIERFTCTGWGNGAWIAEVTPAGAITYSGASSGAPSVGSFLSLAGITFYAEQ